MTVLLRLSLALFAFCFSFPLVAQESRLANADTTTKELKRTAHRLRIPVEQLKNARQTLQEATDLAKRLEPYPVEQFFNLAQSWLNLNRPKAKEAINSFIQDLRSEAANSSDLQSYQRTTSMAMQLMQSTSDSDYEKTQQLIRDWPDPPASLGDAAIGFRNNMEAQAKTQALWRLANSDPDKALALLSQPKNPGEYNYGISAQVAQQLMNMGKKDEALSLIDQMISDFNQHANDPRALQEYESLARTAINLNSDRALTALNQLIAPLMNQTQPNACNGKLRAGDASVDLTCAESKVLSLLRSSAMRPGFALKAIDSVPGLKSKLDGIGGIDSFFGAGMYGAASVSLTFDNPAGKMAGSYQYGNTMTMIDKQTNLLEELKGKAESNPALVKAKLRKAAKGPEDINTLINLAMRAAYQDPELGSLALEIARQLLPQVEPLQKRSEALQNLIRAYRQVDGEVDQGLLQDGFILADQIRQELIQKNEKLPNANPKRWPGITPADSLEVLLVSELSRDSFEKAIRYVRSMDDSSLKLTSLVQIVQALSQSAY